MQSAENSPQATEPVREKIVLWQDHTHGAGYNPKLTLIEFEDGSKCLELKVFGRVIRERYTKAECPRCS